MTGGMHTGTAEAHEEDCRIFDLLQGDARNGTSERESDDGVQCQAGSLRRHFRPGYRSHGNEASHVWRREYFRGRYGKCSNVRPLRESFPDSLLLAVESLPQKLHNISRRLMYSAAGSIPLQKQEFSQRPAAPPRAGPDDGRQPGKASVKLSFQRFFSLWSVPDLQDDFSEC